MAASKLALGKCGPCSGKTQPLAPERIRELLAEVPRWKLAADGKRIARSWRVLDFATGVDFFARIADGRRRGGPPPRPAPRQLPRRDSRVVDARRRRIDR